MFKVFNFRIISLSHRKETYTKFVLGVLSFYADVDNIKSDYFLAECPYYILKKMFKIFIDISMVKSNFQWYRRDGNLSLFLFR